MSQLVLSEDTTIELDGEDVVLLKGTSIQITRDKSLFSIDEQFEVNTDNGKLLVESGDLIQVDVDGEYELTSQSQFISDGKQFLLENGDRFDILEEGVWDEFKRGVLGKDTAAEAVSTIIGQLLKLGQLIVAKAERAAERGEHPYDRLLTSKEMRTLNELYKLNAEGLGGQHLSIGEVVDVLDLEDPMELVGRVRDELVRIGDKRLARRVEAMIPKGIFGKLKQVWKNVAGGKIAKGELSDVRPQKQQVASDDNSLDQAITAAKDRVPDASGQAEVAPKPQKQPTIAGRVKNAKAAMARLKNLWDYINRAYKTGKIDVAAIIKHFSGDVTKEEIQKAIAWGKKLSKKAPAKAKAKPQPKSDLFPHSKSSRPVVSEKS